MGSFYRAMAVLIEAPWLAAGPGLAFLAGWAATRARLPLAAALAWLLYGLYEEGMRRRVLCSGECNIRVDLLALYPALMVLSLLGVVALLRARRRPRG